MQLITPSQQTVTTTYTGGNLGVGAPKNVSATIPLYLERSVTDTFAPQNISAAQSYTATSTAPNGLPSGFVSAIYNRQTGEVFERVAQPFIPSSTNALVATIHKPSSTTTTTATPFQTVPYTAPAPQAPSPKPVAPTVVSSAPVITAPAPITPADEVIISDDVQEAVDIINTLLKKDAVQNMIADYQQNGASSLMSKAMVKRSVQLLWDSDTRQSVKQLIAILKRPDVREAITSPVLLENNDELNKVLKIFQEAGLVPSESKASRTPKKKPVVEKAEAASDEDGATPAEAAGEDVVADPLEDLIDELRTNKADPHAGHKHAEQPKPARHKHKAAVED